MSEYYAIIRSTDHLAHYGVRGMKWGVRKALKRNNGVKLSKQYHKAELKLAKLNEKANISRQKELVKKHNKRAGIALGVGLAGFGAYAGNKAVGKYLKNKYSAVNDTSTTLGDIASKSVRNNGSKKIVGIGKGIEKGEKLSTHSPVGEIPSLSNKRSPHAIIQDVTAGIAGAGLATAAYQKGKALQAKYRAGAKGHAKAVAKRDAWQREMNKAFAGTKYVKSKKRRKSK